MIRILIRFVCQFVQVLFIKRASNNLLFFGHEDSSSGAAILSLHMVKELSKKYNIVFVTEWRGDLNADFKKYARTVFLLPNRRLYKVLFYKGFRTAVLNALPACFDAEQLKANGIRIVTLIHELKCLIEQFHMEDDAARARRYSDAVIFPSNYGRNSFEKYFGGFSCEVLVKPQGLFLTEGLKSNKYENKKTIRERHGLGKKESVVLMVGIGDRRKGMDLFLELALRNIGLPIRFIHIGHIVPEIKEEWDTRQKSYPSNFINIEFIREPERLFQYYDAADVLAMLSREEPFGSVVLESFSAFTPVVGFANSGGYNDIVVDGKTGQLAEYLNLDDFEEKMRKMLANRTMLNEMGNNAHALVSAMTFANYIETVERVIGY